MLFLCAALSALTGAITGTRAPDIAVQIEQVSARGHIAVPSATRAVAAIVQAQRVPAVSTVLAYSAARAFVLIASIPVRGERRRE
ncbi:hypothetical protein PX554_11530 [Sphingomonas sp. H39-1-10]|uniref:hypothetical protein n=1 Tax=Sphingomonas pollutisoli TaxID=3030829 RepID=UPI0023BA0A9E|nr:hypothetical protein [Sphingomonas pollutisoli]MDF0488762.1 hypothetical protein [Sphingomonas pollutisoli]